MQLFQWVLTNQLQLFTILYKEARSLQFNITYSDQENKVDIHKQLNEGMNIHQQSKACRNVFKSGNICTSVYYLCSDNTQHKRGDRINMFKAVCTILGYEVKSAHFNEDSNHIMLCSLNTYLEKRQLFKEKFTCSVVPTYGRCQTFVNDNPRISLLLIKAHTHGTETRKTTAWNEHIVANES